MSKTIHLNDIEIINMNYHVASGRLAVEYALVDDDGVQHEWDYAVFWREMPPEEEHPHPNEQSYPPKHWHELGKNNKNNKDKLVKDVKKILMKILD